MKYNKKKHLALLKEPTKLKRLKTTLSDQEFFKLPSFPPDKNFFKVRKYSIMLISHLQWENREQYFELIEKLLNGPLNGPIDFWELKKKEQLINKAVERLEAELILFEPNPKCEGFAVLLDELISLSDRYCPDPSLRESHEFSEEKLRDLVQTIFSKMKQYFPADSKENL